MDFYEKFILTKRLRKEMAVRRKDEFSGMPDIP